MLMAERPAVKATSLFNGAVLPCIAR